ncbi:hypothetical protein [Alteromonas sediminis]|uniref:hypothetical protein n=1 Tax=Alteromonas sediminis TaxID=2259342 RepID=UPI00140534E9|nr:hypothetical protein [Alteromonas sediminis]
MRKKFALTVFCSSLLFSALCHADSNSVKAEDFEKKQAFLERQVDQTMSVGRAIRSIASHYPQETVIFVDIALDIYPAKYREIIFAAISAQPQATKEIVQIAINKNVSSCPSIVELAIKAEPSYVDFVVHAAAESTPEELDEIVRVAVITEPDSADRIVQTLAREHPNKMVDILSTAMKSVPFVGEYMVDALLAIFPNEAEDVVTTAVRESLVHNNQIERIIEAAQNAGVTEADLTQFALQAGATDEQIAKALVHKNN